MPALPIARCLPIAAALLAASPAAAQTTAGPPPKLLAMTPEQFERSVTLKDDDLENVATITTARGWQRREGLLGIVNDDGFLRAFIDKRSGRTMFQVYHGTRYREHGWAQFRWVNYETGNGITTANVKTLARTRGPCARYRGCTYVEEVGFEVSGALLRDVASRYAPGKAVNWRYRLKARSGAERDGAFVAAEIVGLLRAVDKYRAAKGWPRSRD